MYVCYQATKAGPGKKKSRNLLASAAQVAEILEHATPLDHQSLHWPLWHRQFKVLQG